MVTWLCVFVCHAERMTIYYYKANQTLKTFRGMPMVLNFRLPELPQMLQTERGSDPKSGDTVLE